MESHDAARLIINLDSWYPEHGKYGQLIPGLLELNKTLNNPQRAGTAHVITGSLVDGSVLCSNRMKSFDIDFMVRQVKETFIKQQTENLIKPAEGFPGYIIIDATDDWEALYCYSLWVADKRLTPEKIPRKVLSPEKAKDHIGTDLGKMLPGFVERKRDRVSQKVHQVILALAAFDRTHEEIEALVTPSVVDFPSVVLDCVPAAHAEGWPTSAEAFLQRERCWPNEKTISAIQGGGFHMVPKHPPDGDPDLHWRLSFSVAEAELIIAMSDFQRKCFCLIKLIIYDVLKGIKEKRDLAVTTYHSKTVLFWSCENKTAMWRKGGLGECVLSLLDDLLKCLSQENLPNYFIPENNTLHYVDKAHLREEAGLLKQFRQTLTLAPSSPLNILPPGWKEFPPYIMTVMEEKASDIIRLCIDNFTKSVVKVCRNESEGVTNADIAKKCVYDTVLEIFPALILLFPSQEAILSPGDEDIFKCLIQPTLQGKRMKFQGYLKIMIKAMECVYNTICYRYQLTSEPEFHAQGIKYK